MFEVWAEKYRPKNIDEVIDQEHVRERVRAFLKEKNLPHLLFSGPPGTGKCVDLNTPIFSLSGIKMAKDIKEGDFVLTLGKDGKISSSKVLCRKVRSDEVYEVELEDGSKVKVTKEHPFLTIRNGLPAWKMLEELKVGEYVAVPSFIFFSSNIDIDLRDEKIWIKLEEPLEINVEDFYDGYEAKIIKALMDKEKTRKEIANITGIKYKSVVYFVNKLKKECIIGEDDNRKLRIIKKKIKTNIVPSKTIKLSEYKNFKLGYKFNKKFSSFITFRFVPELFEWLGYLLSEGNIRKGTLVFHNNDKKLLERFAEITKKVFEVYPEVKENRVIIRKATTIYYILEKIGIKLPIKEKSKNIEVPNILYLLDDSYISAFLRAYLDGDGYAGDIIEFYSKSEKLIEGLKILLLKLGISSKIKRSSKYFRLVISGKDINIFAKKVGSLKWSFKEIKNDSKSIEFASNSIKYICSKLNFTYSDLVNRKKEIEYLYRRNSGGIEKIFKIYKKVVEMSREKINKLFNLYLNLKTIEKVFNEISYSEKIYEEIKNYLISKEVRKELSVKTNIRSDRLKEYAISKRIPSLKSFIKILKESKEFEEYYPKLIFALNVRNILIECINELGIAFKEISEFIDEYPENIKTYLSKNPSILKISRLKVIFDYIIKKLEDTIFDEKLISILELLDFLINSQINWVKIKKINYCGKSEVYDFEIENSHNFIGGNGGIILHNTTLAIVISRELYGEAWRSNVLQMNASDERKIEVIREKVKEFARTKPIGDVPFKLIIMDEADNLTSDSQQALRRMMEDYSSITRFIFACNYSSKIIEPIQSRCAVFRFRALPEQYQKEFIMRIVKGEKLKIDENAINAIINLSEGDLRKIANILQVAAMVSKNITEDSIYEAASRAKPKEIAEMIELATSGTIEGFNKAREILRKKLIVEGLAGEDLIKDIYSQIIVSKIPDDKKIRIIESIGEYEFRINEGGNPLIQLTALLAQIANLSKK